MALTKRNGVFWADFYVHGRRYQFSTRQRERRRAKTAADTAKGRILLGMDLFERRATPTLKEFIAERFEPWARGVFEPQPTSTWVNWYRPGLRALSAYAPLASKPMDKITDADAAGFAAARQAEGLAVNSVNAVLRVLRRVLRAAVEWNALAVAPRIRLLAGARSRERVVNPVEESRYLEKAPPMFADLTVLLLDQGLRIGEALALRWEQVTFQNGRHGSLFVAQGKTKAARRGAAHTVGLAHSQA
jgi:integrase